MSVKKQKINDLLKGIETGDPKSTAVVNEAKYIQHNPQTHEGGEGLAQLFKRLSQTNPKVTIVRLFEDGDYVFGHTIYDFATVRIGFEIFRYEGDQVVEHWDNIQPRVGDMVSGETEVRDHDQTETNRTLIKNFIEDCATGGNLENLTKYVNQDYIDHSTLMTMPEKLAAMKYQKHHRTLVEGNFALTVNEGYYGGDHTSFYDLFRLEKQKIVEHWDTTEKVPDKEVWKNNNGKF